MAVARLAWPEDCGACMLPLRRGARFRLCSRRDVAFCTNCARGLVRGALARGGDAPSAMCGCGGTETGDVCLFDIDALHALVFSRGAEAGDHRPIAAADVHALERASHLHAHAHPALWWQARCPGCAALMLAPLAVQARAPERTCHGCTHRAGTTCFRMYAAGHAGRSCEDARVHYEAEQAALARAAAALQAALFMSVFSLPKCPNAACGLPTLKAHGHGCHHITCRCTTRWCYSCRSVLGPGGSCPRGCGTFCTADCRCPTCPECRPGAPCNMPSGSRCHGCRVCQPRA